MSYRSQKCTPEELKTFKDEVILWLDTNFPIWKTKVTLMAFKSYNGDVRLYDGSFIEYTNKKTSRRKLADGYYKGHFNTKICSYITINRDEWPTIKSSLNAVGDEHDFNQELIFSKLS